MNHPAAETLKQQIPLQDYVEGQGWKPVRRIARGRLMGLCPLHDDHKPSFLLDPNINLFYRYGLRPWRRCDPLCRVVSRCGFP